MTRYIVATPANFVPFQIDAGDFQEGTQRSCKGSLHVRPSATMTITADEFSVLKARLPGAVIRSKIQPPPAPAEQPPAKPDVSEEKPKVAAPKPRREEKP